MSDSFDRVVDCFRKSVPLIAYDTADQRHTSAMLRERFLMASKMNPADPLSKPMKKVCVIDWDVASGVTTESKDADALAIVSNLGGKDAAYNPVNVLEKVASASGRFVLLMHNIHRFIDDVVTMQYISNLRDALKVSDIDNRRSLVLFAQRSWQTQSVLLIPTSPCFWGRESDSQGRQWPTLRSEGSDRKLEGT